MKILNRHQTQRITVNKLGKINGYIWSYTFSWKACIGENTLWPNSGTEDNENITLWPIIVGIAENLKITLWRIIVRTADNGNITL